jgi:hypothetical protein
MFAVSSADCKAPLAVIITGNPHVHGGAPHSMTDA